MYVSRLTAWTPRWRFQTVRHSSSTVRTHTVQTMMFSLQIQHCNCYRRFHHIWGWDESLKYCCLLYTNVVYVIGDVEIWVMWLLVSSCISACLSVCLFLCPFLCVEELGSHLTNLHEILYLRIFRKSVEEIQVWLKCDNNKTSFTWIIM